MVAFSTQNSTETTVFISCVNVISDKKFFCGSRLWMVSFSLPWFVSLLQVARSGSATSSRRTLRTRSGAPSSSTSSISRNGEREEDSNQMTQFVKWLYSFSSKSQECGDSNQMTQLVKWVNSLSSPLFQSRILKSNDSICKMTWLFVFFIISFLSNKTQIKWFHL